jgi:tetratricopeptide (TPR) repeat protein
MEGYRVRLEGLALGFALTLVLTLGFGLPAQAQKAEMDRAGQLVKEGKPAEAYAILEPLEEKYAGDVQFDYLLGVAALDSGKSDRATLAFERVLAVNPDFLGARLDMARAYFQLGDAERAKTEFLAVQQLNPPPAAQATIARYLEAIDQIERAKKRTLRSYVELTIGHDSNVNNSGTQSGIAIPALGGLVFTLSPSNLKRSDSFKSAGAGVDYSHQFRPDLGVFAGADARKRLNNHEDTFNLGNLDMRVGVAVGEPAHQVRVALTGGRYSLDDNLSRRAEGATGEWRYSIDPSNQLNAFTQYLRNRFTNAASQANNFDQSTYGVGYLRVLNDGKAALFGAFFEGKERDTDGRADGAKRFYGFRLGGQLMLREDLDAFAVLSSQIADFGRRNTVFLETRRDEQTDVVIGANWRFARDWTLRPQLLHSRSMSNIVIYQYERTEGSLTVRRDFY